MSSEGTRIPRDPAKFLAYMVNTDDWQLSIDPATSAPRFQNWGWTPAESTAWTDFRDRAVVLNTDYATVAKRSTDLLNKIKILLDEVVDYEQDNKLLDRMSVKKIPPAAVEDFEKFNVVRGTVLADTTATTSDATPPQPHVHIKEVTHLTHLLEVTNPDHDGPGRGPGIKEIQVWRALVAGGAPEPDASAYTQIGDAERGRFTSTFEEGDKRKDAYYKARMKGTNGKYGLFCAAVSETVI
jgi:hypothetical protein